MIPVGSLMLNQQFSAGNTLSPTLSPDLYTPSPLDALQAQQIFTQFAQYLQQTQIAIQANSIGADNILSKIAISPEAILIQSSRIGIVGEVTFADWLRDLNGVSTGVLDPSITTIRGGVIHTGIIYNSDNSNYLNLDATGATQFLVSASGVSIKANGQFAFGSTSGNQLTFDGTNVALGGNTLLNGTTTSTVVSGAANGTTALGALGTKLNNNAADVLGGNITFNTSGAFQIGTATWDGTTATGTGIMYNQHGIVAVNAGTIEFVLNGSTGAATFAGALSAATGTFAGNVSTSGSVLATGVTSGFGVQAAIIGSGTQGGVAGITSGSGFTGVYGGSTNSLSPGVQAESNLGQPTNFALQVDGYQLISGQIRSSIVTGTAPLTVASTTLVSNLNAQIWTGITNLGTFAATAGTLQGYINVSFAGTAYKIPYYNV